MMSSTDLLNFFLISYFKKNFLHTMDVLGYLAKLERGLGLAFGARFQHDFSIIMFSIQWTKFQYHISFLSQDIKHNVLLSSYLDS